MKLKSVFLTLACASLACTSSAFAQAAAPVASAAPLTAPVKIGVIDIQAAIMQTKDGQKAVGDLKTKFGPKQSELEKKQSDIQQLQQTLSKGSNAMSDEAKQKTMRDIDSKTTSLKRDTEDAQADLEQENQRMMGDLGGKMISVLNKFATDNGYAIIIDISSQQTPVLFASNTIDVTREIIGLYDKAAPTMTSNPAPARTAPPAARPAAPIKK